MTKNWKIANKTKTDSMDIYIYRGELVAFEFHSYTNQNIYDDLVYLVETRDSVSMNDLHEYFDQNFEMSKSGFLEVFADIVEELRKDDG